MGIDSEVAQRRCCKCGEHKYPIDFWGDDTRCKPCFLARQRARRAQDGNAATKRYEKTPKGFLMRAYRNMQSRIHGVQKEKHHLYRGKALLSRAEFYEWAICHADFLRLFAAYCASGYDQKLAPSVDRKDSAIGYELANMRWLTNSENSALGGRQRWSAVEELSDEDIYGGYLIE